MRISSILILKGREAQKWGVIVRTLSTYKVMLNRLHLLFSKEGNNLGRKMAMVLLVERAIKFVYWSMEP
jgi:hypothetical protein